MPFAQETASQICFMLAGACPGFYETEEMADEEQKFYAKLYRPGSRWTWLVREFDARTSNIYCYCFSGLGPDCDEWGYSNVPELVAAGATLQSNFEPVQAIEGLKRERENLERLFMTTNDVIRRFAG